jgi:hypothetical protein
MRRVPPPSACVARAPEGPDTATPPR